VHFCFRTAAIGLIAATGLAQSPPLLKILNEELARNFRILKEKADPAPYFLSYSVTEQETYAISGTLGSISSKSAGATRILDISLRVGSPKLDNYHRVPGERQRSKFTTGARVVLEDLPEAIKRRLWLETDGVYRNAAQRLTLIKTNSQVKVKAEDASDDFSSVEPVHAVENVPKLKFEAKDWAEKIRKWSAVFQRHPDILSSGVIVLAQREVKSFVSSEGSVLQHGRSFARILISARGKSADGMDLATSETLEAEEPGKLPKDDAVMAAVNRTIKDLEGLLKAPEVEPFVGPAILSGRAAGVFFHEIFGHRIEGHRQKDENEGQTFTKSVGAKVLPEFLSVIFDPTRHAVNGTDLNGWYSFDDEGVPAQRVAVVENGVLKTFLMSRSPIAGFPKSNGHGRRQPGYEVVSRQSNLIVESSKTVSDRRLRELLIEEIKKQNKPYGFYFEQVTGGFTTTGRGGTQAFTVMPLVVYRIYPDGRPDELVRGVDIVGTPLASFSKILATGNQAEIFNGYCGAESGNVPVSAISPALLVSEIEIQKKDRGRDKPPLLAAPSDGGSQ
jgi:TldD protein